MSHFYSDKKDIADWLKSQSVKNWTLTESDNGYTVSAYGDVDLTSRQIEVLPVQFLEVAGNFFISNNQLTSLLGSPQKVGGDYSFSFNRVTSLVGSPRIVGENFQAANNQITSWVGGPKTVGGEFNFFHNHLQSLSGMPESVGSQVFLVGNKALGDIQYIQDFMELQIAAERQRLNSEITESQKSQNVYKI